jgi:hypothetical protein
VVYDLKVTLEWKVGQARVMAVTQGVTAGPGVTLISLTSSPPSCQRACQDTGLTLTCRARRACAFVRPPAHARPQASGLAGSDKEHSGTVKVEEFASMSDEDDYVWEWAGVSAVIARLTTLPITSADHACQTDGIRHTGLHTQWRVDTVSRHSHTHWGVGAAGQQEGSTERSCSRWVHGRALHGVLPPTQAGMHAPRCARLACAGRRRDAQAGGGRC